MARKRFDVIRLIPSKGLMDGGDEQDVPHEGLWNAQSFEFRKGFARTVAGRSKSTTVGQLVSGKRVRTIWEWTQADGTVKLFAVLNGDLWALQGDETDLQLSTPQLNELTLGATSAVVSGTGVTITGGKLKNTVRAGDWFTIAGDGSGSVASVDSDTTLTLNAYSGSASITDDCVIYRKLGQRSEGDVYDDSEVSMAIFDDRLYVADGYGPLHWLSADLTFRPAGLIKPDVVPTVAAANDANGGLTQSSNYIHALAYKDANGTVGPRIDCLEITTAAAAQRVVITPTDAPPSWATRYLAFRTTAGGGTLYRLTRNIDVLVDGTPSSTVITLVAAAQDLRVDAHIQQYVEFATSGNEYKITDNDATTLTVAGADGEAADDWVTIKAEYDIAGSIADGIGDYSADTELDTAFQAPGVITNTSRSYNEPPPTGLKYLTTFRGDGRLAAFESDTGSRIWFSGRPEFAAKTGHAEYYGEGEPEYWPHYHDAGPKDGDEVQGLIEIGFKLCAVKRSSVWNLDHGASDVSLWGWGPVMGSEGIGCIAPKSIVVHKGVAWWLGHVGEETDVIRFDGVFARGFGRPTLGDSLDGILSDYVTEATAAVFEARLYLSYPHEGTTNSRTLRYDFMTRTWDIQPWGCGTFLVRPSDGKLYCGAPNDEGDIFEVLGSAQDNGSDIARVLQTGDVSFPDVEFPTHWTHMQLEVKIE